MKTIVILFFCSVVVMACGNDEGDYQCFGFDIRQCQTDLFASDISESDTTEKRESEMKEWLEDRGYDISDIKLVLNFHDAVCEACQVCPQGDRYFVRKRDSDNEISPDSLQLLNFELIQCGDIF